MKIIIHSNHSSQGGAGMDRSGDLISPKQAARAIGVSESSLKRWCDQGIIRTTRTAGGHRKLAVGDVLRYARDNHYDLVSPELLGLPPISERASAGLKNGGMRLAEALLAGDEIVARQIVFDLYLAKHSRAAIFDEVFAVAFREIGDRWACHAADVYQERRGCEIATHILFDLRRVQSPPNRDWIAAGGTIEGDAYSLPSMMAELVLRDAGFWATSLGSSIPFSSLIQVVQTTKPALFWLSVSHIREDVDFISEFSRLSQVCTEAGTALVVGGRALTDELRQRMNYSAYCDTMQHLEAFATTLRRSTEMKRGSNDKSSGLRHDYSIEA